MNMWELLGFTASPYNTRPLGPRSEDVELLVGRKTEAIEMLTAFESSAGGVYVISGAPGVGKTSFFNVQQYLSETGVAVAGPEYIASSSSCPVRPEDSARDIALRALHILQRSVVQYCTRESLSLPSQTGEIGKWISSRIGHGFEIGLQVFGFGGNYGKSISLPPITDVSFEGIQEAIEVIVGEVVNELGFEGAFLTLDNVENLEDDQLKHLLMSLRDTLFSIPCIWWVLIGQSGLGSLIQTLDSRVFDRITGSGLELKPLSLEELYDAVKRRVQRFHIAVDGTAPIPETVHRHLYEASNGEIRFVFKYCENICVKTVGRFRSRVRADPSTGKDIRSMTRAFGTYMVRNQVPEKLANQILKEIVGSETDGLQLRPKDTHVLKYISEHGYVRPKQYKELGFKSMQDLYSNYISKLYQQNLLIREQEGRAVKYKLRGLVSLASEFGLMQ